MQRIITKQYYFTLLFLSITLIININLVSIYPQEDPTNFLFPSIGKAIDKSIIPKEVSPEIKLSSELYDPREIIPIGVDITTGNATGTVWDDIIIGDDQENFINGSSGNDIIKGLWY